jgi:hypothetical protein
MKLLRKIGKLALRAVSSLLLASFIGFALGGVVSFVAPKLIEKLFSSRIFGVIILAAAGYLVILCRYLIQRACKRKRAVEELLRKIGDFALLALGCLGAVAIGTCVAFLAGVLVLEPISWFNKELTNALFDFGPTFGKFKVPVIVVAIGCLAIWIGVRVANSWKRERERGIDLDEEKGRLQNFLADRKRWIIGLSLVALFLTCEIARDYPQYDKRFHKADRLATGRVVEVDPGEPPSGAGEDADPGSPPSSHYQFQLNGITYDGWIEDELAKGEEIVICYNASDPKFNHAKDESTSFFHEERYTFFLLMLVLAALAYVVWRRKPDEPEPEIGIGDGSFESLREAMIKRVGRNLTAEEEAKARRLADRIQKAKEDEKIAMQKLGEAIEKL